MALLFSRKLLQRIIKKPLDKIMQKIMQRLVVYGNLSDFMRQLKK